MAMGSTSIVTFGALQLLGSGQPRHWSGLADDFEMPRFWMTVIVMVLAGAFGGIAYELLLRKGAIELPHRVRPGTARPAYRHAPEETLIALGTLGRALVGAAAAMTVLLVVAPSTAQAAIALGVTAGAAAPAVIRLMRRQLLFAADAIARLGHRPASGEPAEKSEPKPITRRTAAAPTAADALAAPVAAAAPSALTAPSLSARAHQPHPPPRRPGWRPPVAPTAQVATSPRRPPGGRTRRAAVPAAPVRRPPCSHTLAQTARRPSSPVECLAPVRPHRGGSYDMHPYGVSPRGRVSLFPPIAGHAGACGWRVYLY